MEWSVWFVVTIAILFVLYEYLRMRRKYHENIRQVEAMGVPYLKQFIPYRSIFLNLTSRFTSRFLYTPGFLYSPEVVEVFRKSDKGILAMVSARSISLYVNDPALIKEVCLTKKNSIHKPIHFYGVLDLYGENIVTAPDGANWRKHRQATTPAFGEENCALVARSTIKQLGYMFEKWDRDNHVVWQDDATKLTLSVISEAGFGQSFNMFSNDVHAVPPELQAHGIKMSFKEVMEVLSNYLLLRITLPRWVYKVFPIKFLRRVDQGFNDFQRYAEYFIQERSTENEKRRDILSLLIGSHLNQQDILSNTFIFLVACHETTANTLSFGMALLALHPDIQEEVYQESVAVLGDLDLANIDDYYAYVNKLPLAKAVFDETLRLFPPVATIPKWSVEDTEIGGFPIPAQTEVSLSVWCTHRNEKVWEDANKFNPYRFLNPTPENGHVPFSVGQRSCIGRRFSIIESVLIIALSCLRYRIYPKQCNLDNLKSIITLQPVCPVQLKVERR